MTALRTTLTGMRNGCRAARASLVREVENHLKPLRTSAPQALRDAGSDVAIPYLDRMFDGLRDAIVDGKDSARIALVDTRADDLAAETVALIWAGIARHLASIGLPCDRAWTWHDEGRRSGVVTLIVQL